MHAYTVQFPGYAPIVVMAPNKKAAHDAALVQHRTILNDCTLSPIGKIGDYKPKVGDKLPAFTVNV